MSAFREIINANQGLFNPGTERRLTNEEAEDLAQSHGFTLLIDRDGDFWVFPRQKKLRCFPGERTTRSELLSWIKGAA